MINDSEIPIRIRNSIKKSFDRRVLSIKTNNLEGNDNKYLFVTKELKHIHDSILLRDWRKFMKDNNFEDINIQIFRQSINHLNTMNRYYKEIINEMEVVK